MPNQKIFNQLLIFVNLYQHPKNEAVSFICSGEMVHLKIMQSEWLKAFWPISPEQDLSQQTAGWKDGQTLFHMTLLDTAYGPTSTTAVDWHLKVKDIDYSVDLTELPTVRMQKINSIHKLTL